MSFAACPACGAGDHSPVESSNGYQVLACRQCGLSFSDPMVAAAEPFYRTHLTYRPANRARLRLSDAAVKNRANRKLFALVPPKGKFLDIACGIGSLVKYGLDLGFDAYGIDFNTQSIATGRSALGLQGRLTAGDLFDLESHFPEVGSFDLVTLFEVIEHVSDPGALIRLAGRQLKVGGLLALTCPNEDRWQPTGRIFVDYPPHHLTRWRPATLAQFLEKHCFRRLSTSIDATARDLLWVAYVNRRAARLTAAATTPCGGAVDGESSSAHKLLLDRAIRLACWPADLILKGFGVGTMGMRMVVQKSSL